MSLDVPDTLGKLGSKPLWRPTRKMLYHIAVKKIMTYLRCHRRKWDNLDSLESANLLLQVPLVSITKIRDSVSEKLRINQEKL